MNATFIAIGALFVVLGAGALGRAKKADDPAAAKGSRLSGILFIVAGLIFALAGLLSKD